MSTALLDSFQLIVALYLLYVAIRGSGQMYRFVEESHPEYHIVRRRLRLIYLIGGIVAAADYGVNALQGQMFTRVAEDGGVRIVQNFTVEQLPFLSYDLLSVASTVLTTVLVILLMAVLFWLRRVQARG